MQQQFDSLLPLIVTIGITGIIIFLHSLATYLVIRRYLHNQDKPYSPNRRETFALQALPTLIAQGQDMEDAGIMAVQYADGIIDALDSPTVEQLIQANEEAILDLQNREFTFYPNKNLDNNG